MSCGANEVEQNIFYYTKQNFVIIFSHNKWLLPLFIFVLIFYSSYYYRYYQYEWVMGDRWSLLLLKLLLTSFLFSYKGFGTCGFLFFIFHIRLHLSSTIFLFYSLHWWWMCKKYWCKTSLQNSPCPQTDRHPDSVTQMLQC